MMIHRTLLSAIFTAVAALSAYADSGGPYVGVPDAKASERGPIFQIPPSDKPLRHYLTHMAKLEWDMRINEPTTFSWVPIAGCHASMSSLGHLGGHEILCIRYVSDKRLIKGLTRLKPSFSSLASRTAPLPQFSALPSSSPMAGLKSTIGSLKLCHLAAKGPLESRSRVTSLGPVDSKM
ncbi:hypothetical protein [Verrucomicrobium spinosum]|uniref:hypothetical protein n=1 Tax=Verrucomicrobium spinosum TaxID=2736 RepID=UPI0009464355|nr:hypothetical protein [Verrucomicrobium spinosum]